jgi:hypothetical protein
MGVNGQFHGPEVLPPKKNPWHPFNIRLGGSEQFVVTPACFVV